MVTGSFFQTKVNTTVISTNDAEFQQASPGSGEYLICPITSLEVSEISEVSEIFGISDGVFPGHQRQKILGEEPIMPFWQFSVSLVRTTRTTQCTLLTQALRNTSTAPPQQSMWLTMAGSFSGCSRAALRTLVGGLGWCVFSSAGAEATKKDVGYRLKHPTSLGVSPSLSQCPATMLEVTSSGPHIYCCAGCVWASLHI